MLSGWRTACQLPETPALRFRTSSEAEVQDAQAGLRRDLAACVSDLDRLVTSLTEYLLVHGETEGTATFDLLPHLGGSVTDYQRLVNILNTQHVPVSIEEGGDPQSVGENADRLAEEAGTSNDDDVAQARTTIRVRSMTLPVYSAGSGGRAVVTGFTLRLLHVLKPSQPHRLMGKLEPTTTLENAFYVRDAEYRSVDEAVKRASKQQHLSVTALPPETYFDVAEAVCLYNKLQYWALLASCNVPILRPEAAPPASTADNRPPTPEGISAANEPPSFSESTSAARPVVPSTDAAPAGAAESKPKLVALWRDKWFEQLNLVRRLILHRDYGAFFDDCPYLPLAGRFPMEVPEMPVLKPEDRQGNVFEDVLRRVDRNSVTKFIAFLQRASSHPGRAEHAIRQAKTAGVIRAIGDAVGSIRTPIKTVDLCFQALTVVAQRISCNRVQSPHFSELFPSGFGGDLLEHGFVSGSGRGDDAMGITIPALIIRNFLHRRDAWAVLSQLHPTFVHITERIVQEAARRALPQHFASPGMQRAATAGASDEKAAAEAHTATEGVPPTAAAAAGTTQYRSSEDIFMVASAAVILSHAVTNPNAKRSQLLLLRPCLRQMIRQALDANRCGNCKIAGWTAQTHRLSVAMIRMAAAVVCDWVGEDRGVAATTAKSTARTAVAAAATEGATPSSEASAATHDSSADCGEVVAAQPVSRAEEEEEAATAADPTVVVPSNKQQQPHQKADRFTAYPGFVQDMVTIIREAAHVSCLMSSTMELLEGLSASRQSFAEAVGDDVSALVHAVQVKFIDDGFLDEDDDDTTANGNRPGGGAGFSRGGTNSATVASVAIKDEVMRHTIAFLANVCLVHAHSDAGSVLISLGVHHCVDWGLNVVRWVNKTVADIATDDSRHSFALRLALTTPVVYAELFQQCGAAAVVEATHSLLELLRVAPSTTAAAQRRLLPAVLDWLKKPLWDVVQEDDDDKDDDEQPEDTRRRLHGVRNTILCSLLDAAKTLTAEYPDRSGGPTVEELFSRCVELVGVFGDEVAYLNPVLQCVLNLATCGVSRTALFGAKATLLPVSEASKASDKLVQKFVKLTEAGKTKAAPAAATASAQDKKSKESTLLSVGGGGGGGDSTDRMEYLEHNHNIFQRLVATPNAAGSARASSAPDAPAAAASGASAAPSKQNGASLAAAVPKGFTLISNDRKTHHSKNGNSTTTTTAAGGGQPPSSSAPVPPVKKVRTSESIAKNAQRRSDRLRASQSRRDVEQDDEVAREQQDAPRGRQATAPGELAQGQGAGRTDRRREAASPTATTPPQHPEAGASSSAPAGSTQRKGQQLVNVHGGSEGINLDLLSVKIAHSLNRNAAATKTEGKPAPTSWAHVAKHAMSREQREEEMAAAQRAEEQRLTRLAAERAEMRQQRLLEQQLQQQREEAEQKRRDAERLQQQQHQQLHDARRRVGHDTGFDASPTSDVHALLNKILPKPANVVRRDDGVRVTTRLMSIDEDASSYDDSPAYPSTSAIAASLAQLRIGGQEQSTSGAGNTRQRTHQLSSETLRVSSQDVDTRAPQRPLPGIGAAQSESPTAMQVRFPPPGSVITQPPPQQPQQQPQMPQQGQQQLRQPLSGGGMSPSDAFLSSGFAAFHQAHQQAIVVTGSQSTPATPVPPAAASGSAPASNVWHAVSGGPSSASVYAVGRGTGGAAGSPELDDARVRGGLFGATMPSLQQQQQLQIEMQMLQMTRPSGATAHSGGQSSALPPPQQTPWGSVSVTAGPQHSAAAMQHPAQPPLQGPQQPAVTVGASYAYRPPQHIHIPPQQQQHVQQQQVQQHQQQQHLSYLNPSGLAVGSGPSPMTVTAGYQQQLAHQGQQQQQQQQQPPHQPHHHFMAPLQQQQQQQQQMQHLAVAQQQAATATMTAYHNTGGNYGLNPGHPSHQQQQPQQQGQQRPQPMVSVGGRPSMVPWPSPAAAPGGLFPSDRSALPGNYTQSSTFGGHTGTASLPSQQPPYAHQQQHQAVPAQQLQHQLLQSQYQPPAANRGGGAGISQSISLSSPSAPTNPYSQASSTTSLRHF